MRLLIRFGLGLASVIMAGLWLSAMMGLATR